MRVSDLESSLFSLLLERTHRLDNYDPGIIRKSVSSQGKGEVSVFSRELFP